MYISGGRHGKFLRCLPPTVHCFRHTIWLQSRFNQGKCSVKILQWSGSYKRLIPETAWKETLPCTIKLTTNKINDYELKKKNNNLNAYFLINQ